jgi:phosphatidate cytidylyltransferase
MIAVIAVLLIATGVSRILGAMHRERDYSELWLRIRSWWFMIGALFAAFLLGRSGTIVFVAILSYLALKEFFSLVPTRRVDRRAIFWAYLTIPVQYYWVGSAWYGMFIIFIPVYAFLFIPARLIITGETGGFIRAAGTLHWGVMLAVFALSHLAYLLVLPEQQNPAGGGVGLLLYLLFLTQFNDVAQYVWGKTLGRHKIAPHVSPKKTWEGFIGGVLTTTALGAVLAARLTPLSLQEGLYAGLLIGVAGFFGDLTLSAVKRDLQVKDSGDLIPGHGGILDRLDSLTFTAPLFFHYLFYLHY